TEIVVADAGTLPAGTVPFSSLGGDVVSEAGVLRMDRLEIGLLGDGRIEGELAVDSSRSMRIAGRELPATSARFGLAGIDPAHWVAAARATRIDGEAGLEEGELTAKLQEREGGASLTGRAALALDLLARLGEQEIRIERARIGHGESGLDGSGTIRLEPPAIDLAGQASGVDPSQWLELDDPRLARFTEGRRS